MGVPCSKTLTTSSGINNARSVRGEIRGVTFGDIERDIKTTEELLRRLEHICNTPCFKERYIKTYCHLIELKNELKNNLKNKQQ